MINNPISQVAQTQAVYQGNPAALQQKIQNPTTAGTPGGIPGDLIKLLALKSVEAQQADAANAMALKQQQAQGTPPTVKDALQGKVTATAEDLIRQRLQAVQGQPPQGQPPQGQPVPQPGGLMQLAQGQSQTPAMAEGGEVPRYDGRTDSLVKGGYGETDTPDIYESLAKGTPKDIADYIKSLLGITPTDDYKYTPAPKPTAAPSSSNATSAPVPKPEDAPTVSAPGSVRASSSTSTSKPSAYATDYLDTAMEAAKKLINTDPRKEAETARAEGEKQFGFDEDKRQYEENRAKLLALQKAKQDAAPEVLGSRGLHSFLSGIMATQARPGESSRDATVRQLWGGSEASSAAEQARAAQAIADHTNITDIDTAYRKAKQEGNVKLMELYKNAYDFATRGRDTGVAAMERGAASIMSAQERAKDRAAAAGQHAQDIAFKTLGHTLEYIHTAAVQQATKEASANPMAMADPGFIARRTGEIEDAMRNSQHVAEAYRRANVPMPTAPKSTSTNPAMSAVEAELRRRTMGH